VNPRGIRIDEAKCDGCGVCIPECPEGAIQIIAGKARLVSDLFCDGVRACLGHCPKDTIAVEERGAEPYEEHRVMKNVVRGGDNVIKAHLVHPHASYFEGANGGSDDIGKRWGPNKVTVRQRVSRRPGKC
jgi:MinD superfamily P-loop ATPase